jgi:hydroxylamine reductase (hybrid-cluster protein)
MARHWRLGEFANWKAPKFLSAGHKENVCFLIIKDDRKKMWHKCNIYQTSRVVQIHRIYRQAGT